jgi:hypothetical protein
MAASGWLSSWLSSDAISPTVARRAVACSRSCCWRESSSTLRCALTSSAVLIQPVCSPWPSTSGASKIITAKRSPLRRMKVVS